MKDGRTHLAHKAEHAIDLATGAIVGVTVQGADEGDTTTIQQTLPEAAEQLEAVAAVTEDAMVVIEEVLADKGYHSRTTVHDLEMLEIQTYISEPERGPQSWTDRTRRGLRESTAHPRKSGKTPPSQTRGNARATVCAYLRDRWTPAGARARMRSFVANSTWRRPSLKRPMLPSRIRVPVKRPLLGGYVSLNSSTTQPGQICSSSRI